MPYAKPGNTRTTLRVGPDRRVWIFTLFLSAAGPVAIFASPVSTIWRALMLLAWLVTVTVTCAQAGKRKHGFLDFDQRGLAVLRMQSPDVSVQSGQLTNKAWICGDYAMVRLRIREQDKCVVSVLIAASHQQGAAFSALCRVLRESQKRTDLP